jgi:hypothetical protein
MRASLPDSNKFAYESELVTEQRPIQRILYYILRYYCWLRSSLGLYRTVCICASRVVRTVTIVSFQFPNAAIKKCYYYTIKLKRNDK